jgi:thiol-disulfide isomerase/thioredoxin
MQMRLIFLMLGFATWLPFGSFADQDLQARFEKSVKDAKSIPNVELDWLDTLWISDPAVLKNLNAKVFSRTVKYSYLASGPKYRATCELISGTQSNLMKFSETAFDGKWSVTYSANFRQMTKGRKSPAVTESESGQNPLIEPFTFLTRDTYDSPGPMLRFTDFAYMELTNRLDFQSEQVSDGVIEATMRGRLERKRPTKMKIFMDEAGDSFTPKMINFVDPEKRCEIVTRLLNYTNLGGYQFPTRIEATTSAYPPTSPPTLMLTDTVTVINARIPEQIPDSLFQLDSEEKSADSIWDRDLERFIDAAHEKAISNPIAINQTRTSIYDESADGTKQVGDALDIAKREHKHVLLQFGANWCSWCHKLHNLFQTDNSIAKELKSDYVVVLIDVDKGHNRETNTKYGNPTRFGLPAIVVLDGDGKALITQDTGKLEEGDHHSPEKVIRFLKEWAPKT